MPTKNPFGKFITFEGIDGCGKSSAAKAAYAFLTEKRIPVVLTRQPGGTSLGEEVRNILKNHKGPISPISEVLLFASSFHASMEEIILPSLRKGIWVLSDRWTDSTLAYQCGGRGVDKSTTATILHIAAPVAPDLTLYYDVPPKEADSRIKKRRGKDTTDRIEKEGIEFQEKVHGGFQRLLPSRIIHTISTLDNNEKITAEITCHLIDTILLETRNTK